MTVACIACLVPVWNFAGMPEYLPGRRLAPAISNLGSLCLEPLAAVAAIFAGVTRFLQNFQKRCPAVRACLFFDPVYPRSEGLPRKSKLFQKIVMVGAQ